MNNQEILLKNNFVQLNKKTGQENGTSKVPPHLAAKAGPIHNRNQKEIIVAVPD